MGPIDILGWASIIIMMPAGLFQIRTNWKRKSTEGVSRMMYATLFFGMSGLACVAWLKDGESLPVRAQLTFGAFGAAFVLFQIAWYHPCRRILYDRMTRNVRQYFSGGENGADYTKLH